MTETDKSSLIFRPYPRVIKKHRYFDACLTVGHIPREIFCSCIYYVKEGGVVTGHVLLTNYNVSPVSAGGLEIPLLLSFLVE